MDPFVLIGAGALALSALTYFAGQRRGILRELENQLQGRQQVTQALVTMAEPLVHALRHQKAQFDKSVAAGEVAAYFLTEDPILVPPRDTLLAEALRGTVNLDASSARLWHDANEHCFRLHRRHEAMHKLATLAGARDTVPSRCVGLDRAIDQALNGLLAAIRPAGLIAAADTADVVSRLLEK